MGLRLFNRTIRAFALTEAGERLYQRLAPRMEKIETKIASLMALDARPAGRVRLTLSDHALNLLRPRLQGFLAVHPDVALECKQNHGFRDSVTKGYDPGIRRGESLKAD